jgi:hypothetical protein
VSAAADLIIERARALGQAWADAIRRRDAEARSDAPAAPAAAEVRHASDEDLAARIAELRPRAAQADRPGDDEARRALDAVETELAGRRMKHRRSAP